MVIYQDGNFELSLSAVWASSSECPPDISSNLQSATSMIPPDPCISSSTCQYQCASSPSSEHQHSLQLL